MRKRTVPTQRIKSGAHILRLACACAVMMSCLSTAPARAQVDEDQLGAWYMYFWNARLHDSQFGFQGDVQYRNWDLGGDLEQLLLRGGLTFTPQDSTMLWTLGFASITSGEFGDSSHTTSEERVYQELLVPQKIGQKIYLRHRLRFEQRWVENQDFRTRFRYALFMDIPLNGDDLSKGAVYLSLYNELFLNGQRDIGDGREVDIFDRDRLYAAVGYSATDRTKLQFGYMYQWANTIDKGQLQLSAHQKF